MPNKDSFLGGIQAVLNAILGAIARFFGTLFQAELQIVDNIANIVDKFEKLKNQIEKGTSDIKNFKFDPAWKTRVIWVPDAVKKIQDLTDFIFASDIGIKARFEKIKEPIHQLKLIFSADSNDAGDPQGAVSGFSKTAVKIDEISTMLKQLSTAMDEISDIADFFEKFLKEIQTLDQFFLSQDKSRQVGTFTYAKRQ